MVRTRFAPSPTGHVHIGSLRTALYNYAFARSQGGQFILRIEDTDRKRLVAGASEEIFQILATFGLDWNEGPLVGGSFKPYIQSERTKLGLYQKYAEKLIKEGHAYYCFCPIEPKESKEEEEVGGKRKLRDVCRNLSAKEVEAKLKSQNSPAIRLKVPEGKTVSYFDFIIKKEISWQTENIDEVMLLKSDGFPTYHLAVVVDDVLMEISHVIRGHDWLPSTPVHLLLYQYLNLPLPQIGHLTDILDPQGGKLSKRKGSVSCVELLKEGYLPEALLNFIMLLGWAPKDNRELFTLKEFVDNFQKGSFQIANPIFDRKKLDWFNGLYLRQKDDQEFLQLVKEYAPEGASEVLIAKTVPLVKERMAKLADYEKLAGFFFAKPNPKKNLFEKEAKAHLVATHALLGKINNWQESSIKEALQDLVEKQSWKMGDFFMNFRVALTGSRFTPPITDSAAILGQEETLARLKKAIDCL